MRNFFSSIAALKRTPILTADESCAVNLVRYLSVAERSGRVFVIGDIHGEFVALMSALHAVDFDFERDLAVFVGDLHDRGKNSEKCLDLLQEPWVRSTFGNHEWMMLNAVDETGLIAGNNYDALYQWESNGGEWALTAPQEDLLKWRQQLLDGVPLYWILERGDKGLVMVCHAEPEPSYLADVIALRNRRVPVNDLGGSQTIWGRSIIFSTLSDKLCNQQKRYAHNHSEEILFSLHGHTPVETALWVNNHLYIDTGAVYGKFITLVDIDVAALGRPYGVYSWDVSSNIMISNAAV